MSDIAEINLNSSCFISVFSSHAIYHVATNLSILDAILQEDSPPPSRIGSRLKSSGGERERARERQRSRSPQPRGSYEEQPRGSDDLRYLLQSKRARKQGASCIHMDGYVRRREGERRQSCSNK